MDRLGETMEESKELDEMLRSGCEGVPGMGLSEEDEEGVNAELERMMKEAGLGELEEDSGRKSTTAEEASQLRPLPFHVGVDASLGRIPKDEEAGDREKVVVRPQVEPQEYIVY